MPFQQRPLAGEPARIPPPLLEGVGASPTPGFAALSAASTQTNTVALSGVNSQHRGISIFVNLTAVSGTGPTLTVTLSAIDPISGALITLLASAALGATGTTLLQVYPGIAVAANASANAVLPSQWQVSYTIGGTTPSFTGTIDAVLQP
jgi:hypothetical protein